MGSNGTVEGWIHVLNSAKDFKDSNLVKDMDYVVDYCIQDKPEFAWWVSKVLRRWNGIISKLKSNYWRMTHTFGICFLKTVEYALWFDKEAGNYYWKRSLNK